MKYCDYCGKEVTKESTCRDFCCAEHRRKFFGWTDNKPSVITEMVNKGRKKGGVNHVYLESI
jgi:endogenous inhibitor of DNA gyrase (YacG/DUF329 family)